MKTIPLTELLAKATPGPWIYRPETEHATAGIDAPNGDAILWQSWNAAEGMEHHQDVILAAHAANHIGPLVEALEDMTARYTLLCRDAGCVNLNTDDAITSARKALAAAKNVEVGP